MLVIEVTPEGGEPYEVTAAARDMLKWEKAKDGRSVLTFESAPTLIDLYEIAWYAAVREKKFDGSQELFETTVDVAQAGAKVAQNPTRKGR